MTRYHTYDAAPFLSLTITHSPVKVRHIWSCNLHASLDPRLKNLHPYLLNMCVLFFLLPAFASLFVPFSCYCLLSLHASFFPLSFEILPPTCAASATILERPLAWVFILCVSLLLIMYAVFSSSITKEGQLSRRKESYKNSKRNVCQISAKNPIKRGIQVKVQVFPRPLSLVRGRWNVRLIGVHRQTVRSKESDHKPPSQSTTIALPFN